MTVRLLSGWKDPRTGREYKCSDLLTTDPATENGLVSAKQADTNLSGGNAWVPPASQNTIDASEWLNSTPICIASIGVPFIIPPGDGSANGLQFTGSLGAFTLSAAILTNSWNVLKGCWMYMPASFGGSTYPAGWYWAVFSSDTAGILYTETYVSGRPARPATQTPFSTNLSGWLTTTTAEVTGPTGFLVPGGAMGNSGRLKTHLRCLGNATANKIYRAYLGATLTAYVGSVTTNPDLECLLSSVNQGVQNLQINSRQAGSTGVGVSGGTFSVGAENSSADTSIDQILSLSLQISTTAACAILIHADVTVTHGD
jgi:hypothetical protein